MDTEVMRTLTHNIKQHAFVPSKSVLFLVDRTFKLLGYEWSFLWDREL